MRSAVSILIFALALIVAGRAASTKEAARFLRSPQRYINRAGEAKNRNRLQRKERRFSERQTSEGQTASTVLPSDVRFREVEGRGLLVDAWLNNTGPYTFALDTGAGATIISGRAARASHLTIYADRNTNVGGLSGANNFAGQEARARSLAIGNLTNELPAKGLIIVAENLPPDIDGVLDPTEVYSPLGYVIDMPRHTLSAFDPRIRPLKLNDAPQDGAVVPWLYDSESRRPYVALLPGGQRALLDTGSGFGLALSEAAARSLGIFIGSARGTSRSNNGAQDIAGVSLVAQRINPATVFVGSLALRKVPTDLLSGASTASPILLGRDGLRPFRLTFDPVNRLIEFAPQ